LVRKNLVFSTIDFSAFNHSSLEVQGILLTLDNELIAIVNIYSQSTPLAVFEQLFSSILNKFSKVTLPVISMLTILGGVVNTRTLLGKSYLTL